MIIVATKELIQKQKNFQHDILADINKIQKFHSEISEAKKKDFDISIYDAGRIDQKTQQPAVIKDHINKTGINPIINNKEIKEISFRDISKLYNTKKGAVTTCCGKQLNGQHLNPSHFLCVFSVLAFYLDFKNIQGYIIPND